VQVGIAITIAIRRRLRDNGNACIVRYRETFGTVDQKFSTIREATIDDSEAWRVLEPDAPNYLYVPDDGDERYSSWPEMPELFRVGGVGCQTARDRFIVATSPDILRARFADFSNAQVPNEMLWERYKLRGNRQFDIDGLRASRPAFDERRITRYLYRQLDYRFIYNDERFVDWPGQSAPHFRSHVNVGIAVPRQRRGDGQLATLTTAMTDLNLLGSGTHIYPLHHFGSTIAAGGAEFRGTSNISSVVMAALAEDYGVAPSDEVVFRYIAGMLCSSTYDEHFTGKLTLDHPRIPFTKNFGLFNAVATAAERMIAYQTLRGPESERISRLNGNGAVAVGRVRYNRTSETVHLAGDLTLSPVAPEVWEYKLGQHYVLESYLGARVGRVLTATEQNDIIAIVAAIAGTLRCQPALDELVEAVLRSDCFTRIELGLEIPPLI
jgi:Type ISP C-terminal specificity domain